MEGTWKVRRRGCKKSQGNSAKFGLGRAYKRLISFPRHLHPLPFFRSLVRFSDPTTIRKTRQDVNQWEYRETEDPPFHSVPFQASTFLSTLLILSISFSLSLSRLTYLPSLFCSFLLFVWLAATKRKDTGRTIGSLFFYLNFTLYLISFSTFNFLSFFNTLGSYFPTPFSSLSLSFSLSLLHGS